MDPQSWPLCPAGLPPPHSSGNPLTARPSRASGSRPSPHPGCSLGRCPISCLLATPRAGGQAPRPPPPLAPLFSVPSTSHPRRVLLNAEALIWASPLIWRQPCHVLQAPGHSRLPFISAPSSRWALLSCLTGASSDSPLCTDVTRSKPLVPTPHFLGIKPLPTIPPNSLEGSPPPGSLWPLSAFSSGLFQVFSPLCGTPGPGDAGPAAPRGWGSHATQPRQCVQTRPSRAQPTCRIP